MSPPTDEDDTGEDFAFSLPDIGALIAGPLPSLGPDDLTFIANIDDLDKLHPDAGPSSSITSNGGFQTGAMLPSPRSSFPPGVRLGSTHAFAPHGRGGASDDLDALAPWLPRWSVDESVGTRNVPNAAPNSQSGSFASTILDDEHGAMRAAVRANPRYPKLLDAYFACRRVGADAAGKASLQRRRRQLLKEAADVNAGAMRLALDGCVRAYGADLDEFMDRVTNELTAYAEELNACFDEVVDACRDAEARVAKLAVKTQNALNVSDVSKKSVKAVKHEPKDDDDDESDESDPSDDDDDESAAWVRRRKRKCAKESKTVDTREDDLRKSLKRKYASSILALKDEFLKKTKKGKLPASSTDALKEWWLANLLWPYPSEDAKKALMRLATLNQTQINNWFINQRKRHWHRLFTRDEAQPISEAEARHMILEKYGNVEAFLEVARAA